MAIVDPDPNFYIPPEPAAPPHKWCWWYPDNIGGPIDLEWPGRLEWPSIDNTPPALPSTPVNVLAELIRFRRDDTRKQMETLQKELDSLERMLQAAES